MQSRDDVKNIADHSLVATALGSDAAKDYLSTLSERGVTASKEALANLATLDQPLSEWGATVEDIIGDLHSIGSPATTATAGGRFFGLVVGGTLPAALGARMLSSAWDQVVFNDATSPIGARMEQVAGRWVLEALDLPSECAVGFVTGSTMGTFLCLAAARHQLLAKGGWNVEERGLWGAPQLRVIASEEVHVTVKKALSMLGIGTSIIETVKTDNNGAMLLEEIPVLDANCIIVTQAGNVNSGSVDPIGSICEAANRVGAWVHVDGAFGLWGAASSDHKYMFEGMQNADSWVTDGHKWLNTPYDCGISICKHPDAIHAAMATVAPYLKAGAVAQPKDMVPEFSRSARAVEVWAALKSLGRSGVAELVQGCSLHANHLAERLRKLGWTVENDVVLNQVVATHPSLKGKLADLSAEVRASGEAWFSTTNWKGQEAVRFSVSSWATTRSDIDRLVVAIDNAMANHL
ncbi:pyridoxal-dependent decarboxylase [uncultured Litoreibacter sp.]|uniref:pyridoxal phosphate-dependent decarboxylase family protein n=1 Tax=uncultured Litoreibacter sp. TaxID=1392394 RepID=UPI0026364231|nr:pyridoxal-dependent decarboxylase [uncultured Litoreibacter sp.]